MNRTPQRQGGTFWHCAGPKNRGWRWGAVGRRRGLAPAVAREVDTRRSDLPLGRAGGWGRPSPGQKIREGSRAVTRKRTSMRPRWPLEIGRRRRGLQAGSGQVLLRSPSGHDPRSISAALLAAPQPRIPSPAWVHSLPGLTRASSRWPVPPPFRRGAL